MLDQRLPRVKEEIFNGLSAQLEEGPEEIGRWLAKIASENPCIIMAVDSMGTAGGLQVAALVYKLLDSQAEANEMNGD